MDISLIPGKRLVTKRRAEKKKKKKEKSETPRTLID